MKDWADHEQMLSFRLVFSCQAAGRCSANGLSAGPSTHLPARHRFTSSSSQLITVPLNTLPCLYTYTVYTFMPVGIPSFNLRLKQERLPSHAMSTRCNILPVSGHYSHNNKVNLRNVVCA
jgi:hypothetical protein